MEGVKIMKFAFVILIIVPVTLITVRGWTDSSRQKYKALGKSHKIEMYSGGVLVREWESTGYVENETNSDGFYFRDSKTDKLIRVSFDVVISER